MACHRRRKKSRKDLLWKFQNIRSIKWLNNITKKQIGEGAFGKVYKVSKKSNG